MNELPIEVQEPPKVTYLVKYTYEDQYGIYQQRKITSLTLEGAKQHIKNIVAIDENVIYNLYMVQNITKENRP